MNNLGKNFAGIIGIFLIAVSAGAGRLGDNGSPPTTSLSICGPVCLWYTAKLNNQSFSLQALRIMAGTNWDRGTTMAGMLDAIHAMGLEGYAVKLQASILASIPGQCILLLNPNRTEWGIGHYVLYYSSDDSGIEIVDGIRFGHLSWSELHSAWEGHAIIVGKLPDISQSIFLSGQQIAGVLLMGSAAGAFAGEIAALVKRRSKRPQIDAGVR